MMLSRENARERASFYRFLSRCYRSEVDLAFLEAIKRMSFPEVAGQLGEGYTMLGACLHNLGENAVETLAVDYASAFLAAGSANGAAAIPCESVYASPARIFMQEPWEEVRADYAAHGLGKSSFCADLMEDHLACELEFMALLAEKNDTQAQKRFLENHLLNWVEAFVSDIAKYVRTDFYKAIGLITIGFLRGEAELLAAVESGACGCSHSYSVRNERMANILARLKEHYHVYAPMRFPKRGPKGSDLIRYGEISELTDIVYKEKSHFSAKECFYPVSQTMFFFKGDKCIEKLPDDDKGIILICRACDINAIKCLDTIFLKNGEKDIYYKRMRDKLKLIMLECKDGIENCFCASMG
ncbi:MAG: molecular chaperone TorD family protein, partial [Oscillospiraceae bacterium]|nr:molecular chaperone TorD family protein [Oscillospiraceae bacterium]